MTGSTKGRGARRPSGTTLAVLGGVLLLPAGALWAVAGAVRSEVLLGAGIMLQALGLLLVLICVGLRREGRLGVLVAGTVMIGILGARLARATRRWEEESLAPALVGYGVGLVILGLVTLYVAGRRGARRSSARRPPVSP